MRRVRNDRRRRVGRLDVAERVARARQAPPKRPSPEFGNHRCRRNSCFSRETNVIERGANLRFIPRRELLRKLRRHREHRLRR